MPGSLSPALPSYTFWGSPRSPLSVKQFGLVTIMRLRIDRDVGLTPTNKRVGPPPFNSPVWREGTKDYTVCGVCNRLWRPHLGPVCDVCKKARQKAKAERRRARRGAA